MNESGIAADSHPPGALVTTMHGIRVVVCSDYLRSIESAARLIPGCEPRVSSLFREVGRPLNWNGTIRLPLRLWDYLSRLLWWTNWIATDECIHTARDRAREAALELAKLAEEFGDVLFVGHGALNQLVGRELRRLGWQGPRRATDEHWGMSVYQRSSTI
jgi:broad specificity phosphatase PhoE